MADISCVYTFGEFKLDLRRGALLKRGVDVPLRPKSFAVLRLLVERHGQLVTRNDLMDAVWGHVVVTDGALTQCLIDIRRALDDETQSIVRTITRRGYLFDAPVARASDANHAEVDESPGSVPPEERMAPPLASSSPATTSVRTFGRPMLAFVLTVLVVGGALALSRQAAAPRLPLLAQDAMTPLAPGGSPAPAARPNSIAVLPFVNMSSDPQQEYFADGIAEEILAELARVPELRVIARTSSFAFKHDDKAGVAEIAAKLNVAYVLEGSVRSDADRVRVTAQLVSAADGAHLWSETYDGTRAESLAVQSEIAARVANALEVTLRNPAALNATDPDAFAANDAYLQGRFFYHRRANGDVARARASLEDAVSLDPRHARAWVQLARVYRLQADDGTLDASNGAHLTRQAVQRALEIDPTLAEAHVAAAWAEVESGNAREAAAHIVRAYRLDRDDPAVLGWLAMTYAMLHRFDDWVAVERRILAQDPLSPVVRINHANYLMTTGHLAEARREFLRARALNPDFGPGVAVDLVRLLVLERRFDEALRQASALPAGDDRTQMLALAYDGLQERGASNLELRRLAATVDAANALRVAEIHANRGDADAAFRWITVAYERLGAQPWKSPDGQTLWQLSFSPFLVPLYDDPRWAPLAARAIPPPVTETLKLLPGELS